jgi:hypothetical protein
MCVGPLQKVHIWLMGMEMIIKISIIKIILCGSCSLQRFIVEDWSLLLILKIAFFKDFAKSLINL